MFYVVFFVSKSLVGIEIRKTLKNLTILTRQPRSHVRILLACVAGRRKGGKSKCAREGEGTACKDAFVFFVFFAHLRNVKILIGQI